MASSIDEQIEQARANIRKRKRHFPELFPEWQELEHAKDDVKRARARLAAARKRWKDLAA